MPHSSAITLLLLASATAAGTPVPAGQTATSPGRIILRIPNMPLSPPVQRNLSTADPDEWVASKGPKCIDAGKLGGAIVNGKFVDLVMRGGQRIRATLGGDCATMSYYGGVYFKPWTDGKLCAGRDSVRTRSGNSCAIRQFQKLSPRR